MLLTTHLMDEAEALADTVVIVDHGRVVARLRRSADGGESGNAGLRFRARPGLDTELLVAALPEGFAVGESARARTWWPADRPAGRLHGHGVVRAAGGAGRGAAGGTRSLEDVFLELTGRELRS